MNIEETHKEPTSRQGLHAGTWAFILAPGLIMCLYLGWVYQASWYWYYGIDPIQLNLPLTAIIQQSLALSLLSLSLLLIIYGIIFLLHLIVLVLRNWLSGERRTELASLFSIRDIFQRHVHFVVLFYVALIYLFLQQVETHNSNTPKLEMPANIAMLDAFIIPAAVILFIRLLGDFLYLLPEGVKHRLRLTSELRINDERYRLILDVLIVFATTILFTGVMAVGDASVGFRQNASYQAIRQVSLKSYFPIAGLEPYRQDCDCSPYVYGPMGYLGSNQEYLFLIPWKADGEEYFPQFPLLYQIERSSTNTINIIPDGVSPEKESPPSSGMSLREKGIPAEMVNALHLPRRFLSGCLCSSWRLRSASGEELRPFFGRTLVPSILDKAFKEEL